MKPMPFTLVCFVAMIGCSSRDDVDAPWSVTNVAHLEKVLNIQNTSHDVSDRSPWVYIGDVKGYHMLFKLRTHPFHGTDIEKVCIRSDDLIVNNGFPSDYDPATDFDAYFSKQVKLSTSSKWVQLTKIETATCEVAQYTGP